MSGSVPGVDLERLLPWFRDNVAPVSELSAEIIGHGRSNLTYRIRGNGSSWVLRRPPLSHVQPTAHDMTREFRVISALAATKVRRFAVVPVISRKTSDPPPTLATASITLTSAPEAMP